MKELRDQLSRDGNATISLQMSKPIEEMVAVLWEAMLRQIETRIEERIEAALASLPNRLIPTPEAEAAYRDRPAEYFISLKEVSAMVGLSRSTIYNLERGGTFPKKIHLSQYAVRCKVGAIREWMKSLENIGKTKERVPGVLVAPLQCPTRHGRLGQSLSCPAALCTCRHVERRLSRTAPAGSSSSCPQHSLDLISRVASMTVGPGAEQSQSPTQLTAHFKDEAISGASRIVPTTEW